MTTLKEAIVNTGAVATWSGSYANKRIWKGALEAAAPPFSQNSKMLFTSLLTTRLMAVSYIETGVVLKILVQALTPLIASAQQLRLVGTKLKSSRASPGQHPVNKVRRRIDPAGAIHI
jgi:hypothetical protein